MILEVMPYGRTLSGWGKGGSSKLQQQHYGFFNSSRADLEALY